MAGDWGLLPWTPIYLGVAAMAVAAWRVLPGIMEQINKRQQNRADEKAGDWTRLREEVGRLDSRTKDLEHQRDEQERENERCRTELADATRRIAELEGYMMGRGEALNEAQRIVSGERLSDKVAKDKNGDG